VLDAVLGCCEDWLAEGRVRSCGCGGGAQFHQELGGGGGRRAERGDLAVGGLHDRDQPSASGREEGNGK
jgi:hypothetical protein